MNAKAVATVALLLFVGVSAAYLVVDESRQRRTPAATHEPSAVEQDPPANIGGDAAPTTKEMQHKVIAYYFHGNMRCTTCRKIEAYTEESLQGGFPEELKSGKLEWRVVNVEEPGNGHFVQEYNLSTRSVILADSWNGEQEQWKNLSRVWELVGDEQAFMAYIRGETADFLGGRDG